MGVSAACVPVRGLQGEALGRGFEEAKGLIDRAGDKQDLATLLFEQTFCDAVVEEGEELVVEAVDVEEEYRFRVEFEGLPCEDLEQLFKGAEASGKGDEGIGLFAHEGFAGVHGVGNVELGDAMVCDFELDEDLGDHSDDATVGSERCLRGSLHEADVGSSIDKTDVSLGESASQERGCFTVKRIRSVGRGAEYGNIPDHTLRITAGFKVPDGSSPEKRCIGCRVL